MARSTIAGVPAASRNETKASPLPSWVMTCAVSSFGFALDDAIAAGGAGLRLLAVKDITPLEGGLPVILDGTIIGAIGVSGALSSQDAQVARAGAAAVVK